MTAIIRGGVVDGIECRRDVDGIPRADSAGDYSVVNAATVVSKRAPKTLVCPAGGLMLPSLPELWRYRSVLFVLIWLNVTYRYRQTFLVPLWFVLSPLVRMVAISLLLGGIARLPSDGVPYPIFTYAALLPWELFASGVSRSTKCFVSYHHIISKVYFPRMLLPTAEVCTALVDFALSFGILHGMMAFYGFAFTPRLLIVPVLLVLTLALALGIGLWLGGAQARFRDVSNFVSYLVQFWFFGTPLAYAAGVLTDRLPTTLKTLFLLNPMNGVVEGFRWALLDTGRPPDALFAMSAGLVVLMLFLGSIVFLRTEQSIVDLV
ncbi:MAG: ABC transporter permease [Gemmatimonadota bacterium]|nr:MAG: ABC transporter permease [Gemmatimonadota bacterium]